MAVITDEVAKVAIGLLYRKGLADRSISNDHFPLVITVAEDRHFGVVHHEDQLASSDRVCVVMCVLILQKTVSPPRTHIM